MTSLVEAGDNQPDNNIVFSFQGAFASPHYGHYKSMFFFAKKLLDDYPNSNITMLFMPNGHGSKPHIAYTRKSRMQILNKFCQMLQNEPDFKDKQITFGASDIEYWLCTSGEYDNSFETDRLGKINPTQSYEYVNNKNTIEQLQLGDIGNANQYDVENRIPHFKDEYGTIPTNKETATFRTLPVLKSMFPSHAIILGMGKDNMLQLIYWAYIETYKDIVKSIYTVNRELDDTTKQKTGKFTLYDEIKNGSDEIKNESEKKNFIFEKILPWAMNKYIVESRFGQQIIDGSLLTLKGDKLSGTLNNLTLNFELPKLVVIEDTPPSASSTIMRYCIKKYINDNENNEFFIKIKKLMFGNYDDDGVDKCVRDTINEYRNATKIEFPKDDDDAKNEGEYQKYLSYLNPPLVVGGYKTRRSRSKKNRKNKKNKKSMKKSKKSKKKK